MKPKVLFLFPDSWDQIAFDSVAAYRDEFDLVCEGFDIFRFPENAHLLWFDARRFIDRLASKYRHVGLAGVASTNEQYGALIAATLADRLGLPRTDPLAVIRGQHKFYARELLRNAVPEATPHYAVFPYTIEPHATLPLAFPFFVKPVKATYSILARRVDTMDALQRHLTFHPWEKYIIQRLVKPFNDLMADHVDFTTDAHHLIGEELIGGSQVSIDGFIHDGCTTFFGIVDAVMYPGTTAFQRFEYPSRLPEGVQDRMFALAERAFTALGFDHGLFNIEMFYRHEDGGIKIIEVNPRLAAQFGDLYEKVDGCNPYRVLLDLTVGRASSYQRGQGRYGAAASFVFREFDGAIKVAPDRAQIAWLKAHYPDAHLRTFIKRGNSRRRETKWLGSYRYAIVNLGGRDYDDLFLRFEDICQHIAFGLPMTALRNS